MPIRMPRYLNQRLVYWRKIGTNSSGQPVYASPVEVKCRWENRNEQIVTITGQMLISNALLMTEYELVMDSLVWKGTLAQWRAQPWYPSRPTKPQGGFPTVMIRDTPDRQGRPLLFEAVL